MRDVAESPLLRVRDLAVSFGRGARQVDAVRGVSFDIGEAETVALVGESGSGKSVTALSIMRLLPYPLAWHPSGSIRFRGDEVLTASAERIRALRGDRIAIIFQEPLTSLNPLHSIEKQIAEVLLVHKRISAARARERVIELLHLSGLGEAESRLNDLPHTFSGGQQQRVMIAMALANEPDLLIADEPTTALDVTIQAQILDLLKDLQARMRMALLLITHDLGIVRKMAERVCVMTGGEIVEQGRVADVFTTPRHVYTRRLLAAEPKGRPEPGPADAEEVLCATDAKVWFPIKRGVLKRTVGHVKAVDGISLRLRAGHTLGVVGESGSGKSTLGRALLRLTPSEGSIVFEGRELQGLSWSAIRPMRRRMQIVFQDPYGSLSPRLTVGQIVGEGLQIHRLGTAEERRLRIEAALRGSRPRPGGAGPLSARILRRPAAAHRHRPGAGTQARRHRPGRADQRARHVGPGADRRVAACPATRPRHRLPVHQPRPQGHSRPRPRRLGDARRQGGRAGPRRGDPLPSPRPLHPRADRGRVRHADGSSGGLIFAFHCPSKPGDRPALVNQRNDHLD